MNRSEAFELVSSWTSNKNLVKHMLAVEATMRVLAKHFEEDDPAFAKATADKWGMVGLIHDADYEKYPDKHPLVLVEELQKRDEPQWLIDAIKSHAWGYREDLPEPKAKLEWSLYCCDELTGLIVAVALVRPDRKLSSVTVDSVLKKWGQKAFAAGVKREQIAMCEEKLGIALPEFIGITLSAMQRISDDLGL